MSQENQNQNHIASPVDIFEAYSRGTKDDQGRVNLASTVLESGALGSDNIPVNISDQEIFELQDALAKNGGTPPADLPSDPPSNDNPNPPNPPTDNRTPNPPAAAPGAATPPPANPNPPAADPDGLNVLSQQFVLDLVEQGFWEDGEGEEPVATLEDLRERLPQQVQRLAQNIVNGRLDQAFKDNPNGRDKGALLFELLASGGSVDTFLSVYSGDTINTELLESKEPGIAENTARRLLAEYYTKVSGWDSETLDRQFARWEKNGSFVDEALAISPAYKKYKIKSEADFKAAETQRQTAAQEAGINLGNSVNQLIDKEADFAGYKLGATKAEKDKVREYIFKPVVKIGNQMVSQYVADKHAQAKTPEFTLHEALALMNKNVPTKAIENAQNNQTKGLRDRIRENLSKTNNSAAAAESVITPEDKNAGKKSIKTLFGVDISDPNRARF